jgi:uncharacterized protein (DUF362 family)
VPVLFEQLNEYRADEIQALVSGAFEKLACNLKDKKTAFLKMNVVRPAGPESGVVTHPTVIEGIVLALRDRGITGITIGDGSAAGVDSEEAFRKAGYADLAARIGVRLLDLNASKRVSKPWDFGTLDLPTDVLESDLYISVPKMKTHFHTGVTLSIKNQQGLLTREAKKATHREFDLIPGLVSIAKAIRPHLIVVDAIDSMEGEGPTKGIKKHTGVLVFGTDMLETDVACCRFMGVDPFSIRLMQVAAEKQIGCAEPEIIGEAFEASRTSFKMPSPKPKRILNFYSWQNYRACAEDEHSFEEAIHLALRNPKHWFTFFPKFLYFVLFGNFHLLRGRKARYPESPGRVLCIGECCRDMGQKPGTQFVAGCPPKPEDILDAIKRMK